jgi:DNA transformation protein
MDKLIDMQGIGPRCVQLLNAVDINSPDQLKIIGAIEAYLRIIEETDFTPHIALLYALVGAIEDRHWLDIAKTDKARLRAELEGLNEIRGH